LTIKLTQTADPMRIGVPRNEVTRDLSATLRSSILAVPLIERIWLSSPFHKLLYSSRTCGSPIANLLRFAIGVPAYFRCQRTFAPSPSERLRSDRSPLRVLDRSHNKKPGVERRAKPRMSGLRAMLGCRHPVFVANLTSDRSQTLQLDRP
jgi:hypothetical protein